MIIYIYFLQDISTSTSDEYISLEAVGRDSENCTELSRIQVSEFPHVQHFTEESQCSNSMPTPESGKF